MQQIATGNMELLAPMIISLLLIFVGGLHPSFAMATTTAPNSVTPMTYWEAVLPGIPMPPAISDLLAKQNVISSEVHDAGVSSNSVKFIKGLRKMGQNNEIVVSEPDRANKYVHIAQEVEDDLKEISVSYGSQGQEYMEKGIMLHKPKFHRDLKGQSMSRELLVKEEVEKSLTTHKPKTEENLKEISVSYGLDAETDKKKVPQNLKHILATYRPKNQENLKEISVSYGSNGGEDMKEISDLHVLKGEKDLKEISMSYGVESNDVLKEISVSYGEEGGEGVKEISMSYGIEQNKNPVEVMASYGKEQGDLKEISVSYGVEGGEGVKEISMSYGIEKNNPMGVMASYGKEQGNLKEISVSYGVEGGEGVKEISMSYGTEQNKNPMKVVTSYGKEQGNLKEISVSYGSDEGKHGHNEVLNQGEEDPHKITMSHASEHEEHLKTVSTRHETRIEGTTEHSHHAHTHNQNNKRQQADVFFFHDMLRPGSIITPTIPPTTSLPLLLPRHIASSIPFSTEHLSDIIAMFAPASLRMTREIRWTLETCEHPRTLPGQKAGCATSLESLTELSSSLLGTRHVHAFSAADLPVEAPGTWAVLRGRYNVTAVQKLSGESSEIVTCHDLTYPYAVYYCHTANPTAAYTVTLASVEEDTGAPAKMEALAVCHLDTSQWSPKNPFFELHNVKPGEVTVCHFLTKLSIIWVPGSEQGGTHATA